MDMFGLNFRVFLKIRHKNWCSLASCESETDIRFEITGGGALSVPFFFF